MIPWRKGFKISFLDKKVIFFWKNFIDLVQSKLWMLVQKLFHYILIFLMKNRAGTVNQNTSLFDIKGKFSQYGRLKITQSPDIFFSPPPLQIRVPSYRSKSGTWDICQYSIKFQPFGNGQTVCGISLNCLYNLYLIVDTSP